MIRKKKPIPFVKGPIGYLIPFGTKVRVYRNLHKKCFSVKDMKTGRVIAHTDHIFLKDVTFPVSKSGRERVLKEGRKNVHAFIQGICCAYSGCHFQNKVKYNPYDKGYFFYRKNGREIKTAKEVFICIDYGVAVHN